MRALADYAEFRPLALDLTPCPWPEVHRAVEVDAVPETEPTVEVEDVEPEGIATFWAAVRRGDPITCDCGMGVQPMACCEDECYVWCPGCGHQEEMIGFLDRVRKRPEA